MALVLKGSQSGREERHNGQVKYKTCIFGSLSVTKPEAGVGDQHTKPGPLNHQSNPQIIQWGNENHFQSLPFYSHICIVWEIQCPSLSVGGIEKENMCLLRILYKFILVLNGSRNQPVQVAHTTQSQCFIFFLIFKIFSHLFLLVGG